MEPLAAAPGLTLDGIGAPSTAGQGGRIHQVRARLLHQVESAMNGLNQPGGPAAPVRRNLRQSGGQCNELVT